MTRRAGFVLAAAVLGMAAGPAQGRPTVERGIDVAGPGRVAVVLDRDVYESARSDLADLRLVDHLDRPVPYLLERVDEAPATVKRPVLLNRGFVRGKSASVTVDFEGPVLKHELHLSLSGDNFRRRVVVEGKGRHDDAWTTITDTAYVFAVPAASAAGGAVDASARRYETVGLPENNQQYLRVTVMRGEDERGEVEIREVSAGTAAARRPREVPLAPRLTRTEDIERRETLLTLDLGAKHQPFRAVTVEVADPRFFRGVTLEARADPVPGAAAGTPLPWYVLAECAIYRYQDPQRAVENLRLEVPGRERTIRLRIHNRDDAPLDVRGVSVGVPVERLAFEAGSAGRYRLRYGAPGLGAPSYDLPRTVGDTALWTATAADGALQPPVRVPPLEQRPPWTERHPALLWVGLVATVVALGLVTRRALRAAG